MPYLTIEARVRPDAVERLRDAARAHATASRQDPGNIAFLITTDPFERGHVLLFQEWQTAADVEAHFNAPHTLAFIAAALPLLVGPPEFRMIQPARVVRH